MIAPDLPGHGSRANEVFTLASAAEAIAEAIDEAGGRAVLVGHSLGGYAAMELAATSPQRVRGLVLSGASLEPGGSWAPAFRAFGWFLGSRYVGAGLAQRPVHPGAVSTRYRRADRGRPILGRRRIGRASSDRGPAVPARLAAYPGPTMLLNGELDVILRLGERAFLRAAQHGRRLLIPRATHLAHLDRPDLFSAAVAGFVRSLGR